jgi:hypothetical protein
MLSHLFIFRLRVGKDLLTHFDHYNFSFTSYGLINEFNIASWV